MPTIHIVQGGESLGAIATKYGFSDWSVIYYNSGNETLRRKRPDPNLILPGDTIVIPDKDRPLAPSGAGVLPAGPAPTIHIVQGGESLGAIATKYGFSDWSAIYYNSGNETLRRKRPDPNLIVPGDTIVIPGRNSPPEPPAGDALPAGRANTLSEAGLHFIAAHEGLKTKLYNDAGGKATIGYGHLVHSGVVGTKPSAEAPYVNGITNEKALAFLQNDAALHADAVNRAVRVPLTQNQFDALVSFSFNVGGSAMSTSTLVRIVNERNHAPDEFRRQFGRWVNAGGKRIEGLVHRREHEAALFNEGRYK